MKYRFLYTLYSNLKIAEKQSIVINIYCKTVNISPKELHARNFIRHRESILYLKNFVKKETNKKKSENSKNKFSLIFFNIKMKNEEKYFINIVDRVA